MIETLLDVDNLIVRYGRLAAVRGVSLKVSKGSIVCMIGPNGAGKSTTLAAIAGGVKISGGNVRFSGKSIAGTRPESIAALGVSLVPEGRHVFASLTVEENLQVGASLRRKGSQSNANLVRQLEFFPRLRERRREAAGKLSGGEQQMLVLARALMTNPDLLLIDEPSLGLAPIIVDEVYDLLLELRRERGLTLLINEQSSRRVLRFADEIHVLREGVVQLSGTREQLRDGSAISNAYFGFAGTGDDGGAHGPIPADSDRRP